MNALIVSLAVFAAFFVIMISIAIMMLNFRKVGPNHVLVISGRMATYIDPATGKPVTTSVRFVKGGGTLVFPFVERVDELSLEIMAFDVNISNAPTQQGTTVTVDGFAQVRIGDDAVSLMAASKQLLSKTVEQINDIALQTLEVHLRAILRTLSVEEIKKDRDDIAARISQAAHADMTNLGMVILLFEIRDVHTS